MNTHKKTYLEHVKEDSKSIWGLILIVGFLTGGVTNVVEIFRPPLDEIFVTEEELDKRLRELEFSNESIIPVNPENGRVSPKIIERDSA